jgi:hypothetical protein
MLDMAETMRDLKWNNDDNLLTKYCTHLWRRHRHSFFYKPLFSLYTIEFQFEFQWRIKKKLDFRLDLKKNPETHLFFI